MSDNEQPQEPNPYSNRDHETTKPVDKSDVMAVAGLLGQVSGALSEIDRNNVGGDGHNVRARQMDPKAALKNYAGAGYTSSIQQPVQQATVPVPSMEVPPSAIQPIAQTTVTQIPDNTDELHELKKRVTDLERLVQSYKNVVKFKRGVSYKLTTTKISGEFKDMETILDIVSAELAKQTKTITIKLNDNTKDK